MAQAYIPQRHDLITPYINLEKLRQGQEQQTQELDIRRQQQKTLEQYRQDQITTRHLDMAQHLSGTDPEAATEFWNRNLADKFGSLTFHGKIKGKPTYTLQDTAGEKKWFTSDPLEADERGMPRIIPTGEMGPPKAGAQLTSPEDKIVAGWTNPATGKGYAGLEDAALTPQMRERARQQAYNEDIQRSTAKRGPEKVNPNDWLRYNEQTGDVETAPSDATSQELKQAGFREIRNQKDRERIFGGGTGLDLQFQKVQALADKYKETSAISLKAGQWTGGQIGSGVGVAMQGAGRQLIQFIEKEFGGTRAAASKPLLDVATQYLVPSPIDSNEVVDIKQQGMKVMVDGFKDIGKRSAFGLGPDPKLKEEVNRYVEMVKNLGTGGKPSPKTSGGAGTSQRLRFDAQGNLIP